MASTIKELFFLSLAQNQIICDFFFLTWRFICEKSNCSVQSDGYCIINLYWNMYIKQTLQWKAHDSVILVVTWSPKSNLIASGSEDCHFKIWDPQGQLLFNSIPQLHPVNCIAWSPNGTCCAFSSFSVVCITNLCGVCILYVLYVYN